MEPVRTEERPRAIPAPGVTISSLIEKVSSYGPEGTEELVADAYNAAHAAHRGQVRKSGEPFVYHPLATADVLAELRLDPTTIAAALLHDVLEDTGVTKEELSERFGDEVAEIVDGVTKLKRLPSGNLEEAQAESLRKMIVAMSRDVRVIIIKLADRLHNMRTLAYLKRENQLKKATETLEIYAPLAHRLGIYSMKWELEDLAFATLHPRRYAEIKRLVAARRADREAFINGAAAEFMESLKGELVADEVYVFTPRGDVISLPSGATPIDFAYHVHTEVGHHTIGAKVNDRIVPLDSELVSGDRVEIITGKKGEPSRDWLAVVQSGRARNKIRQFFNKADREDNLSLGREKVVTLLKKQRIGKVPSGVLEDVARLTNCATPDDMLAAVGAGALSAENVANRIV